MTGVLASADQAMSHAQLPAAGPSLLRAGGAAASGAVQRASARGHGGGGYAAQAAALAPSPDRIGDALGGPHGPTLARVQDAFIGDQTAPHGGGGGGAGTPVPTPTPTPTPNGGANAAQGAGGTQGAGGAQGAGGTQGAGGAPTPTGPAAHVEFAGHIRSANTPAAMPDRITPGQDVNVRFRVQGHGEGPIELFVEGGEADVTVAGQAHHTVTGSGTVALNGVHQTSGMVRLVARQGGQIIGQSTPFAVAAIPTAIDIQSASPRSNGDFVLMVVQTATQADSGHPEHLDRVFLTERVGMISQTGSFAGLGITQSPELSAPASGVIPDTHWTPRARMQARGGTIATQQTFMFRDARTGASGIPVARSGFRLDRQVTPMPDSTTRVTFTVAKSPHAGSALGITAAAGIVSGEAFLTQEFPVAPDPTAAHPTSGGAGAQGAAGNAGARGGTAGAGGGGGAGAAGGGH